MKRAAQPSLASPGVSSLIGVSAGPNRSLALVDGEVGLPILVMVKNKYLEIMVQ